MDLTSPKRHSLSSLGFYIWPKMLSPSSLLLLTGLLWISTHDGGPVSLRKSYISFYIPLIVLRVMSRSWLSHRSQQQDLNKSNSTWMFSKCHENFWFLNNGECRWFLLIPAICILCDEYRKYWAYVKHPGHYLWLCWMKNSRMKTTFLSKGFFYTWLSSVILGFLRASYGWEQ